MYWDFASFALPYFFIYAHKVCPRYLVCNFPRTQLQTQAYKVVQQRREYVKFGWILKLFYNTKVSDESKTYCYFELLKTPPEICHTTIARVKYFSDNFPDCINGSSYNDYWRTIRVAKEFAY